MSELIVEMEMPKFCIWRDDKNEPHRCPLLNEDDDCVLQDSNIWMGWNEQYAHCPIVGELPDEHGDLIDRDIMYKQIQLWKSTATDTITLGFLYHIEKLLMCIRPAIAAERKDDEQIH